MIELNKNTKSGNIKFSIKVGNSKTSWIETYEYSLYELVEGFSKNLVNEFNKTEDARYGKGSGDRSLLEVVIN